MVDPYYEPLLRFMIEFITSMYLYLVVDIEIFNVTEFITSILIFFSSFFMIPILFFEINVFLIYSFMSNYGHNSRLLITYFKSCGFKVIRLSLYTWMYD